MSAEAFSYQPTPDIISLKESGIDGVGVVMAVVDSKGHLYVVNEGDKQCGVGLVCEKRREGEFIWQNMQGAMVEEMGVEVGDLEQFWWVEGRSYMGRQKFDVPGRDVRADVVLVYYSGDREVFPSRNEVTGVGFVSKEWLVSKEASVRPAVKPVLMSLLSGTIVADFLYAAQNGVSKRLLFSGEEEIGLIVNNRPQSEDLYV